MQQGRALEELGTVRSSLPHDKIKSDPDTEVLRGTVLGHALAGKKPDGRGGRRYVFCRYLSAGAVTRVQVQAEVVELADTPS